MEVSAQTSYRSGSGEPLVLIHGFSCTRLVWRPVLAPLERDHEVLALNLAGHVGGPQLEPATEPSLSALTAAVERDMDAAGFQTAHLVGNSLGGWIALELARRGRARSVVALSPAGGWEAGSRDERRLRRLFTRSHRFLRALMPRIDPLMRRPRLRRALLWQAVAFGERVPPAVAAQLSRDSLGCAIYFPLLDAILREGPPQTFDGISCPVLLAWGTRDRILPAPRYSGRLRAMLPAARWLELEGLGHIPTFDDPELVATTIREFTASAYERAPAALA
jgi:pimeloyl-ACP methyl ester carboxylesterase